MKATFALLADRDIYNRVRKLGWQLHQAFHMGAVHWQLPPHVSLKQPFGVADLAQLEAYMAEFAASVAPFTVELTELQLQIARVREVEHGILWLDVRETLALRQLHDRLNRALAARFGDTRAEYDGPDYHFHMTVMMGGAPVAVYRAALDSVKEPRVDLAFTARELAMFVYDEPMGPQGVYIDYKILPLGGGEIL